MRDVPSQMAQMLADSPAAPITLARGVVFELRDGTVIAMTDHDEDLVVTLPEVGTVTLLRGAGILVGDIEMTLTLDSGNSEITCPFSAYVGRTQVIGRRFNQAKVWVFDVDWNSFADEYIPIMKGLIGESRVEESVAVFELRDLNDYWNVSVGGVLTPRCRADFGDAQCGVARLEVAATVTTVSTSMLFQTDLAGYADEFWRFGDCQFTSGSLNGVWPIEIVGFTGLTGEIEVLVPFPNAPEIGDQLLVHDGCSRLKESSDVTIPTCFSHSNVTRFRGFDQVPGSDTYLKVQVPGGG